MQINKDKGLMGIGVVIMLLLDKFNITNVQGKSDFYPIIESAFYPIVESAFTLSLNQLFTL